MAEEERVVVRRQVLYQQRGLLNAGTSLSTRKLVGVKEDVGSKVESDMTSCCDGGAAFVYSGAVATKRAGKTPLFSQSCVSEHAESTSIYTF